MKAIRWAAGRGILKGGYGRPFNFVPTWVWGGTAVLIDTDIGELVVPVSDLGARAELIFGRLLHEEHETALLRSLLQAASCVLDIGAHIGWYSVLARNAMGDAGRVHAFEANPHVLPYLEENAARHPGIVVHAAAVSDHAGEIDFFAAPSSNLSSSVRPVGHKVKIQGLPLDQLDLGPVDFVKCDVEGGELRVLRGARLFRKRTPDAIWMIEADEALLAEAGESLAALDEEAGRAGHLYTVRNGWEPIGSFAEMHGSYHKNVLIVPGTALTRFRDALRGASAILS